MRICTETKSKPVPHVHNALCSASLPLTLHAYLSIWSEMSRLTHQASTGVVPLEKMIVGHIYNWEKIVTLIIYKVLMYVCINIILKIVTSI